jgi:hypothetical protein
MRWGWERLEASRATIRRCCGWVYFWPIGTFDIYRFKEKDMPFIKEIEKAEKWLANNETKLKLLGDNGKKIYESLAGLLDGGETGMVASLTGFDDVDEIIKQAGGVDEVIKSKGIDVDGLIDTAMTVLKSALVAASLF